MYDDVDDVDDVQGRRLGIITNPSNCVDRIV